MEPLESHILFVASDGRFAVGAIDELADPDGKYFYGKYVETQSDTFFQHNWTHVVAVGPHILFVRSDGWFEVGHIHQGDPAFPLPQYVNTEGPKPGFSPGWTHVVAVGPHVLLYRSDTGTGTGTGTGHFEVGHIDESTRQYVNTEGPKPALDPGWTHVVAVGPHILFYRFDTGTGTGHFEVGHIDQGKPPILPLYVNTEGPKPGFHHDWTHIVAVGPHVLFVDSADGRFEVGHINQSTGQYVKTAGPKLHPAFAGATHVVVVGSYILSGRANAFEVGYIDEATGDYVHTQSPGPGVGGFPGPDPFHLVAVGPHVLGVSPTMTLGFVGHISTLGQVAETHSGPPFASDWTHVVAVA
jgi:hypothetical protein